MPVVVAFSILFLAATAQATTVRNLNTGELLFADNYEGLDNASGAAFPGDAGDYDPIAQVGIWTISEESTGQQIQVADYANPGAFQGSNYLRTCRTAVAPNNTFTYAMGNLTATQSTAGDLIRFETMFLYDLNGTTDVGLCSFFGDKGILTYVQALPSGIIRTRSSADWGVATGQTFTVGEWTRLVVDYVVGSNDYSVTINGDTVSGCKLWSTADNVKQFRIGPNVTSPVYYDAVPEPSIFISASAGLFGLAAIALAKRD